MLNLVLWNISASASRNDENPSAWWRKERNWFRCIVPGEPRREVGGESGSLEWSGSGDLFYGTDVVIGSLNRATRPRMSFEVE
jgi:hypothetical protein